MNPSGTGRHNRAVRTPLILLTGFEPFGGETVNPSWLVAQAWHGKVIGPAQVQALCLPCVFGEANTAMAEALQRWRPRLVLALGQAAGRADITPERVAINVDDARIADNRGQQPVDQPVQRGAPAAHFSTLPIKAMVAAMRDAGVPASVSQTAGTFVCNHVFYGLMQRLRRRRGVRGGFMHLPLMTEQASAHPGQPCLPLALMTHGVGVALHAAWSHSVDLQEPGGAVS